MMLIFSDLSVFVWRARVERESRSEALEHAKFYLRDREASTFTTYNTGYRKLVEYCMKFDKALCGFGERDVIAYMIFRSKQGVSESQLRQVLSVIALICEVCGFESPSGSSVVIKVKKGIVKEANTGKKKAERIGMTKKKLLKIFEACYDEDFRKVEPERRRFLLMKTICFLGAKRFDDIQKLKKKDVVVRKDNRVKVWMERSKTDSKREGWQFVLTKGKIGSVSVTRLIEWYLESLGDISDEAFIFPVFRKGKPVESQAISYFAARKQLIRERELLELGDITWHSGRIGGATEASKKGVSRCVIMRGGGWRSSAVDSYIRVEEAGVQLGDALL